MNTSETRELVASLQIDLDSAVQAMESLIKNYEAKLSELHAMQPKDRHHPTPPSLPDMELAYIEAARATAARTRAAANRARLFVTGQAAPHAQHER